LPGRNHKCEAFDKHEGGHFGAAVGEIWLDENGKWQAIGGFNEYFSRILFCPFCGIKLEEVTREEAQSADA